MKFHQSISVIIHPIVLPTVGVMLYFLVSPNNYQSNQKLQVLSLIFLVTYIIPLLILIVSKKLKMIDTYQTKTIRERKIPVALMAMVFYLLGNSFYYLPNFSDLSLLFFATSFSLLSIYFLFYYQIKASIHLVSMGISAGFFLMMSTIHNQSYMIIIIIIFLLSGILGSARLHLKAHTAKEVYLGFFIGIISPFILYLVL